MNPDFTQHLLAGAEAGQRYRLILPDETLLGRSGERLGQRAGSSLDFKDYRDYQPGDDLRTIDWGVYARSDKLTVKLFREEVSPHLDLLIDGSKSMNLPGTRKAEATLGLAALLAGAARNAQCSCTAWMQAEGFVRVPHGTDHPAAWDGITFDRAESPAVAFQAMRPAWRSRGLRVFISDLLFEANPTHLVRHLTRDAAAVIVIQVLASEDATPPARGNLRLVDAESNTHLELYLDANLQARYHEALATHQEAWRAACQEADAQFHTLIAEDMVEDWNLAELEAREVLAPI